MPGNTTKRVPFTNNADATHVSVRCLTPGQHNQRANLHGRTADLRQVSLGDSVEIGEAEQVIGDVSIPRDRR